VTRRSRRFLEGFDIYPQSPLGAQGEPLAANMQVSRSSTRWSRGFEDTPGDVQRVVEIVGGGLRLQAGPEQIHSLLPMQLVACGQGEHLDEARRPPQAPSVLFYHARTHRDPEATEQPDT
jgi:hypothetical protein